MTPSHGGPHTRDASSSSALHRVTVVKIVDDMAYHICSHRDCPRKSSKHSTIAWRHSCTQACRKQHGRQQTPWSPPAAGRYFPLALPLASCSLGDAVFLPRLRRQFRCLRLRTPGMPGGRLRGWGQTNKNVTKINHGSSLCIITRCLACVLLPARSTEIEVHDKYLS